MDVSGPAASASVKPSPKYPPRLHPLVPTLHMAILLARCDSTDLRGCPQITSALGPEVCHSCRMRSWRWIATVLLACSGVVWVNARQNSGQDASRDMAQAAAAAKAPLTTMPPRLAASAEDIADYTISVTL